MKKLSMNTKKASALEVIELIKAGWELGYCESLDRAWIQKNGLGHGGETRQSREVHKNTLKSLIRKGLIIVTKNDYPTIHYGLKSEENGKTQTHEP